MPVRRYLSALLWLSAVACTSPSPPSAASASVSTGMAPPEFSPPRDAPYSVAWTRLKATDASRKRPVWIDVWYPASREVRETPRRYSLTVGSAATDADVAPHDAPLSLVLVSHGSMGGADQYIWATEGLAAKGYVVASVHHWGESRVYGRTDPLATFRFSERSLDLRFALDHVASSKRFAGKVSTLRVAGLGHSAGAFTLMTLAGARYSVELLGEYCGSTLAERDVACKMPAHLGVTAETFPRPAERCPSHSDDRLVAVYALDPALGPSFGPEQLASVHSSLRVAAAVPGDFVPSFAHAEHYVRHVPGAELVPLENGEGHFVYLDPCDLKIDVLGVPLCRDAQGVDRARTHDQLLADMVRFFDAQMR